MQNENFALTPSVNQRNKVEQEDILVNKINRSIQRMLFPVVHKHRLRSTQVGRE